MYKFKQKLRSFFFGRRSAEKDVFSRIYSDGGWHRAESRSGSGSTLEQTQIIRKALPNLIRKYRIETMLDIPCGDHHWMQHVEFPDSLNYKGADLVEDLIADNAKSFGAHNRTFVVTDIRCGPMPQVDLVFCRDCLVHFSFRDIILALGTIKKSRSVYLLTTTFPSRSDNADIKTGDWRPINLQLPPFELAKPIDILNEACTENGGAYSDKSLGLWRIEELPE